MTEDFFNSQDNGANNTQSQSGTDDDVTVADRKTAYHALREIAGFLQQLDPHSLTPYLLNLLVGWESKSLPQILADIGKEPPETAAILNMLAVAAGNKPNVASS